MFLFINSFFENSRWWYGSSVILGELYRQWVGKLLKTFTNIYLRRWGELFLGKKNIDYHK